MDCSWPIGMSLNNGVDKDVDMGRNTNLKYPTIDMVVHKILELSGAANAEAVFLWKEEMSHTFCQLMACPKSVPLLGTGGEVDITLIW